MDDLKNIFIGHHLCLLKIIGVFPDSPSLRIFYFGVGIQIFFLIFELWHVSVFYRDFELLVDNLVSTFGVIAGLLKISTFSLKRRTLTVLVNKIQDDWKNKKEPPSLLMKENHFVSHMMAKSVIFLYNSMNFTYFLRTVASRIFDPVQDRKLLAQAIFPFDFRQSPVYEVVVIAQFVTASICFNSNAFIEGFLSVLVLHACSKLDAVQKEIKKFSMICESKPSDKKVLSASLKSLCEKHMNFIEFINNLQDVFSRTSLFHLFFMTLLLVLSSYMVMDGLEKNGKMINLVHYAVLSVSFFVSSSYYCILGEHLTTQSEIVFKELYDCSWYNYTISTKRAVSFMLMKARKPVNIRVGKFNDLNLIYLTRILKTSFSYLSLVRAVK